MANSQVFTLSQIAQHKSKTDCWFVINGRVLDATKFLKEHPGGEEVLMESAGTDATMEFKNVGHSKAAQNLLLKYQVGVLQGHILKETNTNDNLVKESKKEISAFVIKNAYSPKQTPFLEFIVPLLVAGSYFIYRTMTGHIAN